ncbi:LysE family translocator [Nocardiopsis baichengensis]|uniref:LysE family translocator n=1 Tax=Nocardiopsis baichengensis TaxID=280240 RepID=UPI00035EFE02|nr:LysE family translocator [Nocardiopsis baichengensis]
MDPAMVAAFSLAVLLLSIVPGPDMLYIMANAAAGGRKVGVVAALGMCTGLFGHTLAAAFGLGALISAAPHLLDAVRLLGAAFLAYLAFTALRDSRRRKNEAPDATGAAPVPAARSLRRVYAMATLTNLANPKVVLFYLAFLPQFVTTGPGALPVTAQLLLLGCLFVVIGLLVDGTVGIMAGMLSERLLRRGPVRRWIDRACAAVFGALAARLVLDVR